MTINLKTPIMKFIFFSLVIFVLNMTLKVFAYEVDNFTLRYSKLESADKKMDKQVNDVFAKVVEKANKDKIGCSQSDPSDKATKDGHRKFRALLKEAVAPGKVIGVFEEGAEYPCAVLSLGSCDDVPKHKIAVDVSIYGGNAKKKLILAQAGINSNIKLGDSYVGTDKLGHFFDQGFEYYKSWTLNGSETSSFNMGRADENGMFGKMTTGIKSNADLAANFSGFRFWQSATEGNTPYFKCANGEWTQVKKFEWKDFVNDSWDEAINCNQYATDEMSKAVEENLKTLEEKAKKQGLDRKFTCPVDLDACAKIGKLPKAKHYVNSLCLGKKSSGSKDYSAPDTGGRK